MQFVHFGINGVLAPETSPKGLTWGTLRLLSVAKPLMPVTVHVSSLLAGVTYYILKKFLNKLSILTGLVEVRDDQLEQTSVVKLRLVYACDCGSMVSVLTMHFAGPICFFFHCLSVYLSRHYVALGDDIC